VITWNLNFLADREMTYRALAARQEGLLAFPIMIGDRWIPQ
jgi:hypothetical protein